MPTLADMAGVSGTAKVNSRGQQLKQDALAQMAAQEEAQRRAAEWLLSQPDAVKAFLASLQQRVRGASLAELAENPAYVAQAQAGGGQAPMLRNLAADIVGAAGEFAPSRLDVATAGLGKLAALGGKMGMVAGPIVYHGTPHTFAPTEANVLGEFDASKIGEGSGKQSYGHGVYLTEYPHIAKAYQGGGVMYTADLPDEMAEKMLDWEKPLNEQPESVKNALKDFLDETGGYQSSGIGAIDSNNMSGTDAADLLADLRGMWSNEYGPDELLSIEADSPAAAVAEFLRRKGIPGIKYWTTGGSPDETIKSNFVVFPGSEKRVKILKREQ